MYIEALVRATRVSGRFAYGFRTELHFGDEQPILEFNKYTVNESILIISEHESTNFGSPVLFNSSAE
jgi:hypothetical protein